LIAVVVSVRSRAATALLRAAAFDTQEPIYLQQEKQG
jgi:hypothetical protein